MTNTRKTKIAVVDDDVRMLEAMDALLQSAGHVVSLFSSAQLLLNDDALLEIDCLISDIGMPKIDGFELRRRARAARPDLPIIFMTGRDEATDLKRAAAGGHQGFFHKPFDADSLLRAVLNASQPD